MRAWYSRAGPIVFTTLWATMALGPGVAVGLGWLWREDVLAHKSHKAAVKKGREGEKKAVRETIVNARLRRSMRW